MLDHRLRRLSNTELPMFSCLWRITIDLPPKSEAFSDSMEKVTSSHMIRGQSALSDIMAKTTRHLENRE